MGGLVPRPRAAPRRWTGHARTHPTNWRTYDEFAAGIATYRLPNADLSGRELTVTLTTARARAAVRPTPKRSAATVVKGPYDAVAVRDDVFFVNLPHASVTARRSTVVFSTATHRALARAVGHRARARRGVPRVAQTFWAGDRRGRAAGGAPGPSRDLIGKRNVYRYSPEHLYEHVYMSRERYAWQCLQGVQRGHGDIDLSTVWKFQDGLYLFCFREFRSRWRASGCTTSGTRLRTTGVFLGLTGDGESEHSRAGGHIYPLGAVSYPDVQPI